MDMGTRTNKRREWESDGKRRMKGASKAATERGTYAGGSNRTGIKQKAGGNKDARQKKSEGRELREPSEEPFANERVLGKRECPPDTWEERDETWQCDAGQSL